MGPNLRPTPQGQSEDCFVLDVLVPASPVSTPIPVMVQIYGGDYTEGNAALLVSRRCNGEWIKRESDLCLDPVPAGFCSGSQAAGTSPSTAVLNVGLLDQRGGARPGATQHPTFVRRHIKGHHLGWLSRER